MWQCSPIHTPGPMIDELIVVPAPTLTPSSRTDASTRARSATLTPSPSTLRSPTIARRRHRAARRDQHRGDDPALHGRPVDQGQAAPAELAPDLGAHLALEDVVRGLQVAIRGADVHPVPAGLVAVQALTHQRREDLSLDREVGSGRRHPVEHLALEDVGAGADQVRVKLIEPGLLDELHHRAVRIAADQPVGRGIVDRDRATAWPVRPCARAARAARSDPCR